MTTSVVPAPCLLGLTGCSALHPCARCAQAYLEAVIVPALTAAELVEKQGTAFFQAFNHQAALLASWASKCEEGDAEALSLRRRLMGEGATHSSALPSPAASSSSPTPSSPREFSRPAVATIENPKPGVGAGNGATKKTRENSKDTTAPTTKDPAQAQAQDAAKDTAVKEATKDAMKSP